MQKLLKYLIAVLVMVSITLALSSGFVSYGMRPTGNGHSILFDLVINNGRVMDPETMFDAVRNVGIKDGKIAIITTDAIAGKETIDATGHVVAPGFIDTHYHSIDGLSMKMAARDGVTTGMDLEVGAWPIDKWYEAKNGQWPLNYGTGVSQEIVRMVVHDPEVKIEKAYDAPSLLSELRPATCKDGVCGWSVTKSNLEQMNNITKLLDEGLRQGALCISSTIGYASTGIRAYEMYQAMIAAARFGRFVAAHTRYHNNSEPPMEEQLGFYELFGAAVALDAPLLVQHNNTYGWWQIEEVLQAARAKGMNMWSEWYPYTAGSTNIGADFLQPDRIQALGLSYAQIYDPIEDKYLTQTDYERIVKEDPGRLVIGFDQRKEKWLPLWLRMPHMVMASDSMPSYKDWAADFSEYQGHPRTAGARAKTLRLGREYDVPLMFTLSQLSYWHAKHLGDAGIEAMKVRGRMQEGMVADITIFDPVNVKDNATYKAGEQGTPSTGIPYVIVSGQMVVKDSKFQQGVWAGQPIRYPVEQKARFVPVTEEAWVEEFSISIPMQHGADSPGHTDEH